MQTTFKTKTGGTFAPTYFAVYHRKDGSSFKKIQSDIQEYDLEQYENIKRIELYENGTENLSPVMVDVLYNR